MLGASFEIPDILKVITIEPGLPLLITFAPVNSNGFALLARTSQLGYNTAHLRDPQDAWFQRGVSTSLPTPEAVAEHLRALVRSLNPSRVVTVGSSMGGYGALLFAALLRADAALAFAPQTLLDRRLPHTPSSTVQPSPWLDLASADTVASLATTEVCCVYGTDDIVDIWNTTRMGGLRRMTPFAVRQQNHLVIKHMVQNGDFVRLIHHYCGKADLALRSEIDDRTRNPEVVDLVHSLVPMLYMDAADDAVELHCERLTSLHPDWAMPYSVRARIEKRRGRVADAAFWIERAIERSPQSLNFAAEHARILMHLGREAEAIIALRRCLALRRSDYATLCTLAILEARAGNHDVALAVLDHAIQVRPRLQRAQALRDRISVGATPAIPGGDDPVEDM
jgi:hypothetical protein